MKLIPHVMIRLQQQLVLNHDVDRSDKNPRHYRNTGLRARILPNLEVGRLHGQSLVGDGQARPRGLLRILSLTGVLELGGMRPLPQIERVLGLRRERLLRSSLEISRARQCGQART